MSSTGISARHSGSSEVFSNLVDVRGMFEEMREYVILKLPGHFPNYSDYSDIDILCRDADAVQEHILEVGKRYEDKGYRITVSNAAIHRHIDFFPPESVRLNIRFDLIDSLNIYRNIVVDPHYHEVVLDTRRELSCEGSPIWVPAPEHDTALRFLEFLEWMNERPDKQKHLEYVKSQNSLAFIEVLRKHTNVEVALDLETKNLQVAFRNEMTPRSFGNSGPRMDYFMIWGHGLAYTSQILELVRSHGGFDIVALIRKQINDIGKFVSDVYACDTVPFEHLYAKTRYLLTTRPEVLFILVRNKAPKEQYVGEGSFRHIQCTVVRELKDGIRDLFNPRVGAVRTEDHVIHASDYESQVEHVLRVLDLPPLDYYTREPNAKLDVPYHIGRFSDYEVKEVDCDSLYANILGSGLVPVSRTPHFLYVTGEREPYDRYHAQHQGIELTDDHFPEAFDRMIQDFRYGLETAEAKQSLILARQIDAGTYQILDGVHRAAILKSKGVRRVKIAVSREDATDAAGEKVVCIVFSKDRAMQLECMLNSLFVCCEDPSALAVKVLYATSGPLHLKQYQRLMKDYESVEFVRETLFKTDLLSMIGSYDAVMFLVDDNVFIRRFSTNTAVENLRRNPDALGFSLRLSTNTQYCYMVNKPQSVPDRFECAPGILKYQWTQAELDFGYPLELSSSIYRSADLLPLLGELQFKNPNTLEMSLDAWKLSFSKRQSFLLSFQHSVAFCNPINKVQTVYNNRSGALAGYGTDTLAALFEHGYRIDGEAFGSIVPRSVHQEMPLRFKKTHQGSSRSALGDSPCASIIIIAYNGLSHIKLCVESILKNTPLPIEIIVVDNARNDGTSEYLQTLPGIVLVKNPENIGYSPARAQAMSIARGKYLVSLDDDTIVTDGWLGRLIAHAERDSTLGIIGPRTNYASGPQCVPDARYEALESLEAYAHRHAAARAGELLPAQRLVGFCMFITRTVVDRIGCIDYAFGKLFGFDDDDYSLRAQLAGFRLAIADDVFIHHTGGPQGRGDKVYNESMLGAWEMFKRKWGIPPADPYGTPVNVARILARPFDPARHRVPLLPMGAVERFVWKQPAASERILGSLSKGVQKMEQGRLEDTQAQLLLVQDGLLKAARVESEITMYDVSMYLGDSFLRTERLQEAREQYERALRENPESAEACYGLGLCFLYAGFNDVARQMFEAASNLKPEWVLPKEKVLECSVAA
ncbi:MAG: glycosyltransferase [Ignavibacteriales bacterium]|nr:glycosyltransferase [Ignavibacteriales bacterium]